MKSILNNRMGYQSQLSFKKYSLYCTKWEPHPLHYSVRCSARFCDHVNTDTHLNVIRNNLYILIAIWNWDTSTWFNMTMSVQNKRAWFSVTHHRYTILSGGSPAIMVEDLLNPRKLPDTNPCNFFFGNFQQILTETLCNNFVNLWLWSARINAHKTSVALQRNSQRTNLYKPKNFIIKLGTWHNSSGHICKHYVNQESIQMRFSPYLTRQFLLTPNCSCIHELIINNFHRGNELLNHAACLVPHQSKAEIWNRERIYRMPLIKT